MPWPKKQAIAVLLASKRRGDTKTANKAKKSLKKRNPHPKGGYR